MQQRLAQELPKYIQTLSLIQNFAPKSRVNQHINEYIDNFGKHPLKDYSFETSWASHLHKLRPMIYANDLENGKVSIDLFEAHHRQSEMMQYVSKQEISFIDDEKLVKDYLRFLLLFKINHQQILVPTKNIDLVWHLHLDNHRKYLAETKRLCGRVIDHDDTLDEKVLKDGMNQSQKLWLNQYQQPLPMSITPGSSVSPKLKSSSTPTSSSSSCGGLGITDYFVLNQIINGSSSSHHSYHHSSSSSDSGYSSSFDSSFSSSSDSYSSSSSDSSDSSCGGSSSCGSCGGD